MIVPAREVIPFKGYTIVHAWLGPAARPHSVVQLPGAGSNESVSVRAYGWRRYRQDVHRRSCVLTGQGAR